jgi:hypothetical protein
MGLRSLVYVRAGDPGFGRTGPATEDEVTQRTPEELAAIQTLLTAAAEAQDAFWEALGDLEELTGDLDDIDCLELRNYTAETICEYAEEEHYEASEETEEDEA